jgi:hypothetical protein
MLLSYSHNCIIYNAILNNSNPADNDDILLLQNLRSASDLTKIEEYYSRAKELVSKIIIQQGNTVETWDHYYNTYVGNIINLLKNNETEEATNKILEMLDLVETELS